MSPFKRVKEKHLQRITEKVNSGSLKVGLKMKMKGKKQYLIINCQDYKSK